MVYATCCGRCGSSQVHTYVGMTVWSRAEYLTTLYQNSSPHEVVSYDTWNCNAKTGWVESKESYVWKESAHKALNSWRLRSALFSEYASILLAPFGSLAIFFYYNLFSINRAPTLILLKLRSSASRLCKWGETITQLLRTSYPRLHLLKRLFATYKTRFSNTTSLLQCNSFRLASFVTQQPGQLRCGHTRYVW